MQKKKKKGKGAKKKNELISINVTYPIAVFVRQVHKCKATTHARTAEH